MPDYVRAPVIRYLKLDRFLGEAVGSALAMQVGVLGRQVAPVGPLSQSSSTQFASPMPLRERFLAVQRSTTSRCIGASLASKRFCDAKGTCSARIAACKFSTSAVMSARWMPMSLCAARMSRPV